jgi:hypothetical protein
LADGSAPLLVALRFAVFVALAVLGPGVGLQRLVHRRWDVALVIPLGLLFGASAHWLSLVVAVGGVFPVLALLASLPVLLPGLWRERTPGPSLRGALPPVLLLVTLFAFTQYPVNRVGSDGAFLLDVGEHIDTAVHVGVTWELVAGRPAQVPGLAGVEMRYHVGSHLVRAAAARWAGVHPYDSLSRFDITLWALALVLALRAVVHILGLGRATLVLAGFLPLAADMSFIPGLLLGVEYWAFKLGGNFVEALFYANSIAPAVALALAALVALERAERGEGRRWLVLAAVLGAGVGGFKAFTGAQLLLALAVAWGLRRNRRSLVAPGLAVALSVVLLALGSRAPSGATGAQVEVLPFAPANPARLAFGLPEVGGLALLVSGLVWLLFTLGPRLVGVPGALRALVGDSAAAASLAAFALLGWPLATFVRITADPAYDESFYFVQASGLALWLFAVPPLTRTGPRAALGIGLAALLVLPPTVEFVARKAAQAPERIPARAVRAMNALAAASRPGDVVLTRPGVAHVPLPVVLAGRRVTLANYIPYWRQFTSPAVVAERERRVRSFFRAETPAAALAVAHELHARFAYLPGRPKTDLVDAGVLEPVFEEGRERVYRIAERSRHAPEGPS